MDKEYLCVLGIGYVGLPLACLAAKNGYQVFGLDLNRKLVKKVNNKELPFQDEFIRKYLPKVAGNGLIATTDASVIKKCNIVIVCVPTPVDRKYQPDFTPLISAVKTIVSNLKKGQLIVIESTINPGVCEEIVLPIFNEAGYKEGEDFYLAHAPERINPGDPKWNVSNLPRNVGAVSKTGLKKAVKFYESIINAKINSMKSIKEAEATKTIENAFRDINIAFINEIAKSFDQLNIDVLDVIQGASSKFSFMAHYPGCGVGGHCIPVDPYYLIQKAASVGFSHDFLKLARDINNKMPDYTVKLLQNELNELKLPMKGAKVAVLGLAYKADIDDIRESPAIEVIDSLKKLKADIYTFDPFIHEQSTEKSLAEILEKTTAIILVTDHTKFKQKLTAKTLSRYNIKVIVDGKNCLSKEAIQAVGIRYKGIGR